MKNILINPSLACFFTETAEKIYGVDPFDTKRARTNVNARIAVSVKMFEAGETHEAIAEFINKDRTTVYHSIRKHATDMKYNR